MTEDEGVTGDNRYEEDVADEDPPPAPGLQVSALAALQLMLRSVPTDINVQPIPEAKAVMFSFTTPQGVNAYFFDAGMCIQIANGIIDAAKVARSGLQIATEMPKLIDPTQNGGGR